MLRKLRNIHSRNIFLFSWRNCWYIEGPLAELRLQLQSYIYLWSRFYQFTASSYIYKKCRYLFYLWIQSNIILNAFLELKVIPSQLSPLFMKYHFQCVTILLYFMWDFLCNSSYHMKFHSIISLEQKMVLLTCELFCTCCLFMIAYNCSIYQEQYSSCSWALIPSHG